MPPYLNELSPWERKQEYYHTIQLGSNVKEQTKVLNKQTKVMITSQLASANAIIVSQERISEGIDNVACGVERVEQGIFELKSAFEWGISEVVWQIEQNRAVLKDILEVLMAPLDTQAKERRKRAQEAYTNGWIEDAEEEFLESEKLNKFDFSIHMSLGMIYLFNRIDKEKALSYFEKAIKYSKPKSTFYTSYALLYKALIHFDMGNNNDAEKSSAEAIRLSPKFTEAIYQNAQYNAQLLNIDKSMANLEKAIKSDKLYCLKANKDKMFDPIRESVNKLFEKLRNEEKKKAQNSFIQLSEIHNASKPIIVDISRENFINASSWLTKSKKFDSELKGLRSLIERDSYYDFLKTNDKIPSIQKEQNGLVEDLKGRLKYAVEYTQRDISDAKERHKKTIKEYFGKAGMAIVYGSFIVPALLVLLSADGWGKLAFIVFLIPIFSQLVTIVVLYSMISDYTTMDTGDLTFFYGIVLYIVGSIIYFLTSKFSSKNVMTSEIKKRKDLKESALPFLERVRDLSKLKDKFAVSVAFGDKKINVLNFETFGDKKINK